MVLISGAGSGLGRAIARRLAAGGATAVVADIDEAGADGDRTADRGGGRLPRSRPGWT